MFLPLYSKNLLKTVHKPHANKNKGKQTMLFTTVKTAINNLCQIVDRTCDSCFLTNWWHVPQFARPRWRNIKKAPSVVPTLTKTIDHGRNWHIMHCCRNIAESPMAETGFDLSSAWRNLESGEARTSVAPWFSKTRDYAATLA